MPDQSRHDISCDSVEGIMLDEWEDESNFGLDFDDADWKMFGKFCANYTNIFYSTSTKSPNVDTRLLVAKVLREVLKNVEIALHVFDLK